jgi:cell division septum initiation protein DivIVA
MLDNVRAEYKSLQNVNKKLNEKVRFLEECLDRKEKLNEEYRKQIDKYKSQYEHSM